MKILKTLLKGLFWLLILGLLVAPMGLIYQISREESKRYQSPAPPVIRETSFGKPVMAVKLDLEESAVVSGTFLSNSRVYVELPQYEPSKIRWLVQPGDELQVGQVIGTYKGDDVLSEVDGILETIQAYQEGDAYYRCRVYEPLELECRVSTTTLNTLRRIEEGLRTKYDEPVTLTYAAKMKNDDGTTTIRLKVDSQDYFYGEEAEDLVIYTGRFFENALVLPTDCLYHKPGDDKTWYARQVTEDGIFVEEWKVAVAYNNGSTACVSGVEEGQYFDSGYKVVAEGGAKT